MASVAVVVAVLSALVVTGKTEACTISLGETLESAFDDAAGVVLAEVKSGHRTASTPSPEDPYPVESVTFKVLISWKGTHTPGSLLKFETPIGPGSCGTTIDPDMRLLVAAPAKQLDAGGIWVLFLNGASAPYQLGSPSGQIGRGAEINLKRLFELSKQRPRGDEPNYALERTVTRLWFSAGARIANACARGHTFMRQCPAAQRER